MRIECADPAACKAIAAQMVPLVTWMVIATVCFAVSVEVYRLHSSKRAYSEDSP